MSINFDLLAIGQEYERPFLAEEWGYGSHHAISRGVITPAGQNVVVLFVTHEKQQALTQYNDYIDGDLLFWEGESKHGSDDRIISAQKKGDEIYLFYRVRHHSPFVYKGRVILEDYQRHINQPSEFIFRITSHSKGIDPFEDIAEHNAEFIALPETERTAIVKSRIGQGSFRRGLIRLWGGCSVSGLKNLDLLIASHAKPWRDCTNEERLTPYNGLLLNPNLDVLFDSGYVGFGDNGKIQLSSRMTKDEYLSLGVEPTMRLRKNYSDTLRFLEYHKEYVFKYSV